MKITIDTAAELSDFDRAVLQRLLGDSATPAEEATPPARKRAARKTPVQAAEPVAETVAEPVAETVAEPVAEPVAATLADATAAAKRLLECKPPRVAEVKAALSLVGADRIGSLTPDQIPGFIAALEG